MKFSQKAYCLPLDGLRGFAALSVVTFHLGHWLHRPGLASNSGLAVDLFFCLSGFVLPLAYGKKRDDLSVAGFMGLRLVRLMPLIVLASLMSVAYVVPRSAHLGGDLSLMAATYALVLGLLNLPYFSAPVEIGGPQLFPLNGPQFSLFLELVVNIVWWGLRKVDQLRLALVLAPLCFLALILVGIGGDTPANFWSGFPRVGASFFAGVAMFELAPRLPAWKGWTLAFWCLAALMAVLFFLPFALPFALQLVWIGLLSPLLVLAGARAEVDGVAARLCSLGGALSYPIYCLHYPLFCWINGLYRSHFGDQNIAVEGPLVVAIVLVACYGILHFYDEPVRAWLSRRMRRPRRASA